MPPKRRRACIWCPEWSNRTLAEQPIVRPRPRGVASRDNKMLHTKSIAEMARDLKARKVSSEELTRAFL